MPTLCPRLASASRIRRGFHLELVNAQHSGPGMELNCTATDCSAESVSQIRCAGRHPLFMLSKAPLCDGSG
jgi:hypothetical protein